MTKPKARSSRNSCQSDSGAQLSLSGKAWRSQSSRDEQLQPSEELIDALLRVRGLLPVEEPTGRAAFLKPSLNAVAHPRELPGAARAAEIILEALRAERSIVIYGDYDVDGITATAILWHMLRTIQGSMQTSGKLTAYIPHRIEEGYGLNEEALRKFKADKVDLVVTVDCGVSSMHHANVAKEIGLDLIITDHHALRSDGQLPDALAVIHPRHPDSTHEFKDLCGASVAWKLAWMLAVAYCKSDRVAEILRIELQRLLPLAALGTIADIVPLIGENRVITALGLRMMRTTGIVGLDALLAQKGIGSEINAETIAFRVAPRLNACGRLGHAEDAIELFTKADKARAGEIVDALEKLNLKRKRIEEEVFAKVQSLLQGSRERGERQPRIVVLADDAWHPGVVGITCSRVVEAFGRPCILLGGNGGKFKGSGRSIPGFELHKALEGASKHLLTHGGHAMAVGLQCKPEEVEALQAALEKYAQAHLPETPAASPEVYDIACRFDAFTDRMLAAMRAFEPCGSGNLPPTFLVPGVFLSGPPKPIGTHGEHLALQLKASAMPVQSEKETLRAMWWRGGKFAEALKLGMRVDLLARPKLNEFRGKKSIEAEIIDVRVAMDAKA